MTRVAIASLGGCYHQVVRPPRYFAKFANRFCRHADASVRLDCMSPVMMPLFFRIEKGSYGGVALDGLNVALVIHAPGPMVEGNWAVGAYIDQRADDKQTEALGAIFTGAAGGPIATFAPRKARSCPSCYQG